MHRASCDLPVCRHVSEIVAAQILEEFAKIVLEDFSEHFSPPDSRGLVLTKLHIKTGELRKKSGSGRALQWRSGAPKLQISMSLVVVETCP